MEEPSSPGRSPVEVRQCIEELLKFTLESHMNSSLELDLPLSKDYCSSLLKHHDPVTPDVADSLNNPLYRCLASALHEYISCVASCGTFNNIGPLNEDNDRKKREEWNDLILKEGSEIVNILKSIDFEIHVQEPFFTQLKDGLKTVEGRCAVGDYNRIGYGALILCNKCLVLEVLDVHHYMSFSEMLQAEGLAKVLPGIKTIHEGVQVYRNFYTEEKEKSNGVLAICVKKSAAQPYLHLARIFSGLSDDGLQILPGFIHCGTTVAETQLLP